MSNQKKTKQNVKNSDQKKKMDKTNKILLVIFLVLCVVVFVLATIMITRSADQRNNKYDIEVPLTENDLEDGVDIDISMDGVKKNESKEYRIRVVNYTDDEVNTNTLNYQTTVSQKEKSNIDIELYSSNSNTELLDGKDNIKGLVLDKDNKISTTYTLKLTQKNEETKDEYVSVNFKDDNKDENKSDK